MTARLFASAGLVLLSLAPCALSAQRPSRPVESAVEPTALRAMVWVNTGTRVYHCPGSKYYGTTKDGEFMTEAAARARRNRAAEGSGCTAAALRAGPPAPGTPGLVWLDTATGRYHCPGSRSYARTERGRFLEERAAVRAGHAPAVRPCR